MDFNLVTTWYGIPSKYNKKLYFHWIKKLFKTNTPIILFTDTKGENDLKILISKLKRKTPLKINFIITEFSNLEMQKYIKIFEENYLIDEEKIHSPELYLLWSMKPLFMKKAIELNPFNSSYMLWCDIGAVRDRYHKDLLKNPCNISYFKEQNDKIILVGIKSLKKHKNYNKYNSKMITIGGGLWGGSIFAISNWIKAYQETFETFIKKNIFVGKDQFIMLHTYLNN